MAQMHPRHEPAEGEASAAQRRLYAILRDRLDDDWHVIYGAPRHFKVANGRLGRGTFDFLILHPAYGIAVVTAQDGHLTYDQSADKWQVSAPDGTARDRTPNPFQQMEESFRALKYFLKKAPETAAQHYDLVPAVWLCEMEWQPRHLAEFPDELILDSRDLAQPAEALARCAAFVHVTPEPNKLAPEAVAAFLARFDPDLAPPTLAEAIRIDNRAIAYLTQAQCDRLGALLRVRRCAVPGEAGSGKTILAFETARILAGQGRRTLFLCVNEFQADWLRDKQDEECDADTEMFDILDIRALCVALAQEAGIASGDIAPAWIVSTDGQAQMGQIVQRAVTKLKQRAAPATWGYDALVIDEGQDIQRPLLRATSLLLRDPAVGYFILWYDARQRLDFADEWHVPEALPVLPALTENLRNARGVVEAMARFSPGLTLAPHHGPAGRPAEYLVPAAGPAGQAADAALQEALHDVLMRLIAREGIAPGAILLITCRSDKASRWRQWRAAFQDIPLRPLTQLRRLAAEEREQYVTLSTIRAAKGLERDIVILVEPDGVAEESPARHDKLLYVAISRARHHLIVLGAPADIAPRGII
jgi:hypothetical protein